MRTHNHRDLEDIRKIGSIVSVITSDNDSTTQIAMAPEHLNYSSCLWVNKWMRYVYGIAYKNSQPGQEVILSIL